MVLSIITSCRKDAFEGTATDENGTTYVRFVNSSAKAPINELYFTPFTDVKKIQLWDLRRDIHSKASLNTTITVTLEADQSTIDAYNTENDTDFELLPESIYTLDAPGYTKTATGYTITFNPGEFARPFNINLDGSLYDLDKKYAVAFKVTTITGDAKLTNVVEEKTIMVTIGIKNKYDGVYEVEEGTCVDANGVYIGDYPGAAYYDEDYPRQYTLSTVDDKTVLFYDISWDYPNYIIINSATGGATNSGLRPLIKFDLSTNDIESITDYTGTRDVTNVSGKFNPGDRSIELTYKTLSGRLTITEKLKFIEER